MTQLVIVAKSKIRHDFETANQEAFETLIKELIKLVVDAAARGETDTGVDAKSELMASLVAEYFTRSGYESSRTGLHVGVRWG